MKVLFTATVVKTHIMQFHIPYLKMFQEMGWETAVAARNDYENPADCVIPYCDVYYDIKFERNPLNPKNLEAYRELKRILDEGEYDLVHCHTPVGGMLTRLAAGSARKKGSKIFYTAHGFHFYQGAPLLNWLVYYPLERWMARKTDVLITINQEDYQRAKHFPAKQVVYIPGVGVDLQRFAPDRAARLAKRKELGLGEEEFALLSVGELIPRKNHALVLEALARLRREGKLEKIRYLICGRGKIEAELRQKAEALGVADRVAFLGYRKDVPQLCNACDLFVFMSLQEGLPVALMEAMACGLPVVCSRIRGNTDLVESGVNGEILDSTPEALAESIQRLRLDPVRRERYAASAGRTVQAYDLQNVQEQMKKVYLENL